MRRTFFNAHSALKYKMENISLSLQNKQKNSSPSVAYQGFGSVFTSYGSGSSILGWIPIRIQSRSRVNMTKKWEKFITEKKCFFFYQTTIYLSLCLHKGRPSYKRSLQLSKENIQHFKTFALLNPDSEYGSGSRRKKHTNPDPQYCIL
jgi:hypothetical protein